MELGTIGEVGGERDAGVGAEDAGHDVEEPRREVGVALRQPPLALEVLQGAHDLDGLLEGVHADRVALPARADRERPVGGVGRLARHGRLEPAEPGRRGRDRERARRVGGLGDDGAVGAEAGLDAGEGAEHVPRAVSSPTTECSCRSPCEAGSGVRQRPGGEPHGDGRGLHVGRAEPVEAPVDGSPRSTGLPPTHSPSTGGTVSMWPLRISERPPPAPARTPTRLTRSGSSASRWVVEAGFAVALLEQVVHAGLAAEVLGAVDAGVVRVDRLQADELLQERHRLVAPRLDGRDRARHEAARESSRCARTTRAFSRTRIGAGWWDRGAPEYESGGRPSRSRPAPVDDRRRERLRGRRHLVELARARPGSARA